MKSKNHIFFYHLTLKSNPYVARETKRVAHPWCRAYSVEVEHIFLLFVMVKLGVILLNGVEVVPKNDYWHICT
jgi:hypothetical protein